MTLTLNITYSLGENVHFEDSVEKDVVTDGDVEKAFYSLHRKHKKAREMFMRIINEQK